MKVLGHETLFFDSERRVPNQGLDYDEFGDVTEVALISSTRGHILTTLVQPRKTDPSDYSKLGYSSASLAAAPPYSQVSRQLKAEMAGKEVWCWNLAHEKVVFPWMSSTLESGSQLYNMQCLMTRSAPYINGWISRYGCYKWPKQTDVAAAFGLRYQDPGAHQATADATMCRDILAYLQRTELTWCLPREAANEPFLIEDQSDFMPW